MLVSALSVSRVLLNRASIGISTAENSVKAA